MKSYWHERADTKRTQLIMFRARKALCPAPNRREDDASWGIGLVVLIIQPLYGCDGASANAIQFVSPCIHFSVFTLGPYRQL